MLSAVDGVLVSEQPDWVLLQGDTTTVMMAAIAAQHRQVRVGHVEAGLRTGDRRSRHPEEMNRVVTDHVNELLFAPAARARANLLCEAICDWTIRVTGNTVVDALLVMAEQPWSPEPVSRVAKLPHDRDWSLVTAHCRENFGTPFTGICQALRRIALEQGDSLHIIYPVHRNPQVWDPVHDASAGQPGIALLPPWIATP